MEEGYSSFTTSLSSPFVDAIQTARANVTKEFDQFYDYVSKAMTPRRSQHQSTSSHTIHKALPQTTKRIRQKLDGRHINNKTISSLTSIVERQSLSTEMMAPYQNSGRDGRYYMKSPTSRRRQKNYPPPRPMTLTPNTLRTYSVLDSDSSDIGPPLLQQQDDDDDDDKDDQGPNVYFHSPHRSTHTPKHSFYTSTTTTTTPSRIVYSTPSRKTTALDDSHVSSTLCVSTPSVILHDHLDEESRRLDQLQHDVLLVQQQSLALSHFSSSSSWCVQSLLTDNDNLILNKTDSYLPPPPPPPSSSSQQRRQQRRQSYSTSTAHHLQHTKKYTHSFNDKASPGYQPLADSTTPPRPPIENPIISSSPIFTTSTPLGSPSTTFQQPLEEQRQEHPLFTPSAHVPKTPTPTTTNTQPHSIRSNSPNVTQSPRRHQRRQLEPKSMTDDLFDDMPKAPLSTCNSITRPNGSNRINNKFWEFETKSSSQQHNSVDITTNSPMSTTSSTSRKRKQQQQMDEDAMEEEDTYWMGAAESERHQGLEDDEPYQRHAKTLDQELGMAKDKFDTLQQQQQQQRIESKTFSLRPSGAPLFLDDDDDNRTTLQNRGTIDGDRWTFAGQHYTVHEKQE